MGVLPIHTYGCTTGIAVGASLLLTIIQEGALQIRLRVLGSGAPRKKPYDRVHAYKPRGYKPWVSILLLCTLWLFNIAMENHNWPIEIDGLPI